MRVRKRDVWRDERVAAEYEARRFATPLQRLKHRHDVRVVLGLLPPSGGGRRLLDLPSGTGRLHPALAAAGYSVVGCDVAREMLRAGHGPRRACLVQADAGRLPFRDASFDAILSVRFLFHLSPEERRPCLAEMRRVLGTGQAARVVGEVRYRWTLKHLGRWLRSRFGLARRYRPAADRAALARELAEVGLRLVELRRVSLFFSDKAFFLARRVEDC